MLIMTLQRRYSVTGNTTLDGSRAPPPIVGMRSPKITAIQPTVQTSSNPRESVTSPDLVSDRRPPKRDATQLPSPNDVDPKWLPTKIAKLAIEAVEAPPLPPPEPVRAPTGFLDLPPEIRNQIYRELPDTLISSRPLIYCLSTFKGRKQHCLASVCRQIRSESLAIFYGYNTWVIKLEFKLMYDAFKAWISSIGDVNAGNLRLLQLSVRSRDFRPVPPGGNAADADVYTCADGDATFRIDLSERFPGGEVTVMRCDGSAAAGEVARARLQDLIEPLWQKRVAGTLTGQDFIVAVDDFLGHTGWWL